MVDTRQLVIGTVIKETKVIIYRFRMTITGEKAISMPGFEVSYRVLVYLVSFNPI